MPANVELLVEELKREGYMTDGIKLILDTSDVNATGIQHKQRMASAFYSTLHMERAVDSLITSNKELSESSDKYAKALNWLTGALVIVSIIQVVLFIVN